VTEDFDFHISYL